MLPVPASSTLFPYTTLFRSDPRYELVQKLLEYKRFKDNAALLERQGQLHADRFPRIPAKLEGDADEPPPVDLDRSEEHTSELQSQFQLVCRLLLEKKK